MKTEPETEAVLSPAEVRKILGVCSPDAVLVGGQALGFWADHFSVSRPENLRAAVSADVDFIGGSALARQLGEALGWKWWIPSLDDATEQSGKVTLRMPDNSIKQVDFLFAVAGLTTTDIVRRAIEMRVPDIGTVRVMHPIDVLDSRIQNLLLIPAKRTKAGIAQAHLSVAVVRAFIQNEIQRGGEKPALKLLERVAAIAGSPGAIRVFLTYGVDPLLAVPMEDFRTTSALHSKRWPQITAHVNSQREKTGQLLAALKASSRTTKRKRR
jgi:hypothetical protein